jgi:hypothetical protein
MTMINLKVNGRSVAVDTDPATSLLISPMISRCEPNSAAVSVSAELCPVIVKGKLCVRA